MRTRIKMLILLFLDFKKLVLKPVLKYGNLSESKVLQYLGNMRQNPDAFAKMMKVMNHTWLWDAELVWYFLSATHLICRGHKSDETHWTVIWRARLILSDCYLMDLTLWILNILSANLSSKQNPILTWADIRSRYEHMYNLFNATYTSIQSFLVNLQFINTNKIIN